jgi:hypothetical protein
MHCDSVQITTDTTSLTITSQGVVRDGRGFVDLTLPDADPQQRRTLEWAKWFRYELYRNGARLYASPQLALSETRRASDGALVVAGSP